MYMTEDNLKIFAKCKYQKEIKDLMPYQLHEVVSDVVMTSICEKWNACKKAQNQQRRGYYLSAEFLVGRAVYNNLMCTGLADEISECLIKNGADLNNLEEIEDAALGNGGLGRLAACFLDSAATLGLPLDGYGIRYRYGLFKQRLENGFQQAEADDWTKYGDPWSVRVDEDAVTVNFGDMAVKAVPYDMPVIGYGAKNISTLRLWQSEALCQFDFNKFNDQQYVDAVELKNKAEDISRVLYPNDSTDEGKMLRLKQQYFFSSASLQDMIRRYKVKHGSDYSCFASEITIQLNDTHPVISIPELIRLLMIENVSFDEALNIACECFNYTNHTIMQEALEKWDLKLITKLNSEIADIIVKINDVLLKNLVENVIEKSKYDKFLIVQDKTVHMAYLACFCCKYINGVAKLHTDILMDDVLKDWYMLTPLKFQNKTNGITQRRWLCLCNKGLSSIITELLGSNNWVTNLDCLKDLEKYATDKDVLDRFISVKQDNKKVLAEYIKKHENIDIDVDSSFDIQIKRLHEYKRQLLNILVILELYFEIKEGTLTDFKPTTFIFGAKSAVGYLRARGIIKLINEVAKLIDNDSVVSKYIKVIFVSNYNVSYAEKLIAAADVSEQISTAGTEASGTGNMKFMLNGAATIGTYDGANVEIVEKAGEDNNYIFGLRVDDIKELEYSYDAREYYEKDYRIKRVLDALVDGTLDDCDTGMFKELYTSLLDGASWHKADHYYLLADFNEYLATKIKLNNEQKDKYVYAKKCWINMCNAGFFSSDRTISQYAKEIWKIEKYEI